MRPMLSAVLILIAGAAPAGAQAAFDLGLGLGVHLAAEASSPGSRWGTAAMAGRDLLVRRDWTLGVRWRGVWIPDDLARRSRYSLSAEVRAPIPGERSVYAVGGFGLGLATVVTRDLDFIGIGDNGGLVAIGGLGYQPPRNGRARWGLETAVLRHWVPDDALWTGMAVIRLRLGR